MTAPEQVEVKQPYDLLSLPVKLFVRLQNFALQGDFEPALMRAGSYHTKGYCTLAGRLVGQDNLSGS